MAGATRYSYIPTCILFMLIISDAFDGEFSKSLKKYITPVILIICIKINIDNYKGCMMYVYAPDYPKWKNEVAKWRADTTYNPRIHPASKEWKDVWKVKM